MRRTSLVLLAAALAAFVLVPAGTGLAAGPEGCVVTAPSNPGYANPCSYTATAPGGIVGGGSFKVTIKRGKRKIVLTDKQGNNWSIGTIKPKDKVTAQVTSSAGFVAVGNPCPASVPGAC